MGRFESYGQGLPGVEPGELTGWLIVVEGTDGVGRTTHIDLLRRGSRATGYAVAETGLTRSALAGKGLQAAKEGTRSARTRSICSTRPISPTGSSARSCPRCAPASSC